VTRDARACFLERVFFECCSGCAHSERLTTLHLQVTHQAMFNMMAAYSRRLGISEEEVNEHCRQLQEAWNAGQRLSADAICEKALRQKKSLIEGQPAQTKQAKLVLQQQHPNMMHSSHDVEQHQKDIIPAKNAMQPSHKPHRAENPGDVLDARLMAIRRANWEADDGNTRTRQ
jgi:hypothetical protein